MPSDAPTLDATLADRALEALTPRVEAFHSAVATAEEEIRTFVTHQRGASEYRAEQALVELGPFAIGRIDPEKFGLLLGDQEEIDEESQNVLDRAEQILNDYATSMDFHRVAVEPGGDLRDVVKGALDHVGQVFGAARAVELARSGLFESEKHNHFLGHLPFRKWNRAERQLAPPLIVEVEADDLLPAGLGEFLDGQVKLVLVVTGVTTAAPLARLITPQTYVVQTTDPADLAGLATSPHPGVALLFDEERQAQARFVHDPDAGDSPGQRLSVMHMPQRADVGRGRRAPLWLEELEHLEELARKSPVRKAAADDAVDVEVPAGEEASSADQLAAWLLTQTDLEGL
jgi:hypothetical protein